MTARWTYEVEHQGPVPGVPELVMIGFDENRKALGLAEHSHPGCFEFVFVEKGHTAWELDGSTFDTFTGDVFHTKPGELHRGKYEVIEPSRFWWVIVEAPHEGGWMGLRQGESQLFEDAFRSIPRVGSVGPHPSEPFSRIRKNLLNKGPFWGIHVRQALLDLLLLFAAQESHAAPLAQHLSVRFNELIERMTQNPTWRPTVRELATYIGVSESHFYRTFLAYTGLSPINYTERLRMKEACRRLTETDETVTVIAHDLGYLTSQHFSTVFKRFTGTTPSGWRSRDTRRD